MKLLLVISINLLFSCNTGVLEKKTFVCKTTSIELELPKILKTQKHTYEEGEITLLTTKDKVIIEFFCGGNYIPHTSNRERYKLLFEKAGAQFGIDKETKLFWRKEGKMIYSNCRASDTTKYNNIFKNKIIKKLY
ncbi:hypothetical protein [uncultured Aquimarina sp.]|uniref:hypothetical protein n=1 Tax=uncultured Aquimarina sp. TaxID=575652 RepID=UPI002628A90E|nr:hypothetical protein [uncultured Aquimarina sp.]